MFEKTLKLLIEMKNGDRLAVITNKNTVACFKMCYDTKGSLDEDFTFEVEGTPVKIHEVDNARWFPIDVI
mgnify:CR=1 FL=1|jgi:hypothetical protein